MRKTPNPKGCPSLPLISLRLIHASALLPLAGALMLGGCISQMPDYPSGDPRHKMTHAERWKSAGSLQVYSEQVWGRKIGGGPTSFVYSEYKVLTPEGRFVMQVENGGPMDEPSVVRIDPGSYVVLAQAYERGTVRLPVTVRTGKTTVLHLEKASADTAAR